VSDANALSIGKDVEMDGFWVPIVVITGVYVALTFELVKSHAAAGIDMEIISVKSTNPSKNSRRRRP
jgi:pyruvate/2-oxoglutarate/acetoin dehydrogenase E1 component